MKKMLLVFVVFVLAGVVSALPNPSTVYCEEMNYTSNETHCIFSENESCELWSFFNGSCGSEYVIELFCVEAGESLGPATECCGGLVGLDNFRIDETGECVGLIGGYLKCSDCGNGVCEDWENKCNCEEDCGGDSGKGFSSGWILLILAAVIFAIIGFKILKWLFWSLAVLAIVLAIWFFVF